MKRFLVVIGACLWMVGCGDYGGGEKIGTVIRLAQHGVFCKTYEATLIRGGIQNGSGGFAQPFDFTIEDPTLLKQVEAALDSQQEVKIKYHSEIATFCRAESENHFLTGIEAFHAVPLVR